MLTDRATAGRCKEQHRSPRRGVSLDCSIYNSCKVNLLKIESPSIDDCFTWFIVVQIDMLSVFYQYLITLHIQNKLRGSITDANSYKVMDFSGNF